MRFPVPWVSPSFVHSEDVSRKYLVSIESRAPGVSRRLVPQQKAYEGEEVPYVLVGPISHVRKTGEWNMILSDTEHTSPLLGINAICGCVLVLALLWCSFTRNGVWQDPVLLWEDAARKSPQKGRIYNNIGEAYHEKKQLRKAIENYLISIQLSPSSSLDAYGNIGSMYADLGEYDRAIQVYSQLLLIDQNDAITYASRGRVYFLQGQHDKAIKDFSTAAQISPFNATVYLYRGKSYEQRGNKQAALQDYRTACSLGEASACRMLSTN